jgi:hypothetical protein
MCFFNSAEQEYLDLEQNEHFSPLDSLTDRKHSFQKVTQFSEGNNVLCSPSCNAAGFLLRVTRVSSAQLTRPVWTKMHVSSS